MDDPDDPITGHVDHLDDPWGIYIRYTLYGDFGVMWMGLKRRTFAPYNVIPIWILVIAGVFSNAML